MVDGDVKIMGIFDGHGPNGYMVSSIAMSMMLDFFKNSNLLRGKDFLASGENMPEQEMTKVIKCAFKYT